MRRWGRAGLGAAILALTLLAAAPSVAQNSKLDPVGVAYVKLALGVAQHDPNYLDAYFGPQAWVDEAKAHPGSTAELEAEADRLMGEAAGVDPHGLSRLERKRRAFLESQLRAVRAKLAMLDGQTLSYLDEAQALYGVRPELPALTSFDPALARIDALVPGPGPLSDRVAAYRAGFVVPKDRLEPVMRAALAECRRRTRAHIVLPKGEHVDLEIVSGKPWAAYNWYKGQGHSLIQVNTDYPMQLDHALELACHEGYPGHHVHNALLEQRLAVARGWAEFEVYPLSTPFFFVAEGMGNSAVNIAFSETDRARFERDVLFPLAGLPPAQAQAYVALSLAVKVLNPAAMTITAAYIDGRIDKPTAVHQIQTYAVLGPDQAEQSVGLMSYFRSYGVNYGAGERLVRRFVEGGGTATREQQWRRYSSLLTTPTVPSDLQPRR